MYRLLYLGMVGGSQGAGAHLIVSLLDDRLELVAGCLSLISDKAYISAKF